MSWQSHGRKKLMPVRKAPASAKSKNSTGEPKPRRAGLIYGLLLPATTNHRYEANEASAEEGHRGRLWRGRRLVIDSPGHGIRAGMVPPNIYCQVVGLKKQRSTIKSKRLWRVVKIDIGTTVLHDESTVDECVKRPGGTSPMTWASSQ